MQGFQPSKGWKPLMFYIFRNRLPQSISEFLSAIFDVGLVKTAYLAR
jgi:hypothetical protein